MNKKIVPLSEAHGVTLTLRLPLAAVTGSYLSLVKQGLGNRNVRVDSPERQW